MAGSIRKKTTKALVTAREPSLSAPIESRTPVTTRPDRSKGSQSKLQVTTKEEPSASLHNALEMGPLDLLAYQRDVLERTILFFDTLRKRANAMLEHERAGLPPVLNFKYEMLLDARQFEQPANYALRQFVSLLRLGR